MEQPQNDVPSPDSGRTPDADEYINDTRFHQTFTIPPGPDRPEPFKITYSDYGYRNLEEPERENVVLFCGPLLGTRLLHIAKDKLAKKYRIRIIHPDRPGFGGTTNVEAASRLQVWLEMVPALLQHLGVAHVSVLCQSAGTLYGLHTVLHLSDLLHPTRPYVAFAAPWVHPTHSGATLMRAAAALPAQAVSWLDGLASLVVGRAGPVLGASSAFVGALTGGGPDTSRPPPAPGADPVLLAFEERGLPPRLMARVYAENVRGLSEDALLALRKAGGPAWADWGDVDAYVPMLAAREEARAAAGGARASPSAPLEVETFFSETDHMIGDVTGPKWWEDCWKSESRGGRIHYQSQVIKGADHDSILNLRFGVAETIFRRISSMGEEESV